MRTTRPAARPPLALFEFYAGPLDVIASRLRLLHGLDPANPFVACERRYVFPFGKGVAVGNEGLTKVRGNLVHDTGAEACVGHSPRLAAHLQLPQWGRIETSDRAE